MGLLVDQYKENGTKILDELTQKRDVEKAQILENLGQKTKEIVSMYTDAKKFVMKTEADLEENSISVFEKQWRKKQEDIQRQISEGRRVSE